MLLRDEITVYERVVVDYNPDTGKHEEVKYGEKKYICNVSVSKDYVSDIPQGRFTGKTLKVRFIQPVPKFKFAEYKGKRYQPTGYVTYKNKMSVTLEEVVGSVD